MAHDRMTAAGLRAPLALFASLVLAACGGGGERVGPAPAPPVVAPAPSPPPPTNEVISDLKADVRLGTTAGTLNAILEVPTARVTAANAYGGPVAVDYEAASRTYTLACQP